MMNENLEKQEITHDKKQEKTRNMNKTKTAVSTYLLEC